MPEESRLGQVPLDETLDFSSPEPGIYIHKVPSSCCFGEVAFGGFLSSLIHKVAAHFVSQSPKTANHHDVQQSSIQFFRPIFPDPRKIKLHLTIASANKGWTVLHEETSQNGKVCNAGYITLCDFSAPGTLTAESKWKLSPPAHPVDLEAVTHDGDPGWISYRTPWNPRGVRKPHMYVTHYLPDPWPAVMAGHTSDQWLEARWPTTDSQPARWTDSTIPFVLESPAPLANETADPEYGIWRRLAREARRQMQARKEGRNDSDLDDQESLSETRWIGATLTSNIEVKKRLPPEGVTKLFVRAVFRRLINNRSDYQVTLMDEDGDLVALCNQVMVLLPKDIKHERKAETVKKGEAKKVPGAPKL